MKKTLSLLISSFLVLTVLAGCGSSNDAAEDKTLPPPTPDKVQQGPAAATSEK